MGGGQKSVDVCLAYLTILNLGGGYRGGPPTRWGPPIHPKSESPGSPDNYEYSAERLSENVTSIKNTLFAELLTVISPYLCSVIAINCQQKH